MEQIKNDKKKIILLCLLSAGLAGVVFTAFCVIQGIAPFGGMSIMRNDALHQYVPFLADYINRIKTGGSMLYSWTDGGANQFALTAYYLLSPFNLLALPFNSTNMDIGFWLIILVKTMFIGLTACYYFQKKSEKSDILTVAFALIYTFSGFYMAYYYNTMWLDALIMLPLIALGIENIVNGKKATLYFCSLAYAIFVNFYLGYMICIFSVLYFFYLLFSKDVTRNSSEKAEDEAPIGTVLVKYGFASVFAGLVCAAVILPVIYAIGNTLGRSSFSDDSSLFNVLDFLSFHLTGVNPPILDVTTETAPYAMSSLLTLLTVPAFFFLKNVKPNKKIAAAVVILIFYFSFSIPKMNYFWHGFSAPNGLPYRFVFIYLFFIICLAYELVRNIKEVPVWAFAVSGVLTAAAIIYTRFTDFASHFDSRVIVISVIAAVVYLAVLVALKYVRKGSTVISFIICIAVIAEIITGNFGAVASAGEYDKIFPYNAQVKQAEEFIASQGDSAYTRLEIVDGKNNIYNSAAVYGYSGISSFSSLADTDYAMTQRMLGNEGNLFSKYAYYPQTPIYNAAFSLDYVLDMNGSIDENSPFYEKVKDVDGGTLYKVKYTLPVGYCADEEIEHWDPYIYLTLSVHSLLFSSVSGADNALTAAAPDNINYVNCNPVSADKVSEYLNQRLEDGTLVEEDAEHDHEHEDEHDHEDEDVQQSADDNAVDYDLDAQGIGDILQTSGDMYAFKAAADGFSIEFTYTAQQDGEIFAVANAGTMQTLTVTKADGTKREIDISEKHISDIGYFKAGEQYTLTVSDPDRPLESYNADYIITDSIQMSVASVNEEKFLEGYNQILKNGTLKADEFDDTYIYGTVSSTVDGYMMMPMPYDLGWTVWVDGEQVELHEHESHIMMFPISTGEHEIEMSYFPQGLKEGIFVSVAAVLGLALVLLLGRVHKMKLELEAEEKAKAAEAADGEADPDGSGE